MRTRFISKPRSFPCRVLNVQNCENRILSFSRNEDEGLRVTDYSAACFSMSIMWKTNLFVLFLSLPAAGHPGGSDITRDDRDLVQWHVHPRSSVELTLSEAEVCPPAPA